MRILSGTEFRKDVPSIKLPEFDGDLDAFKEELEDLARRQINSFFRDKKLFCGGPIPNSYLMSEASITTVVSTQFGQGVKLFYDVVAGRLPQNTLDDEEDQLPTDISFFLSLLHETHENHVWIKFRAGMILLYLKLCKGYKIPAVPYDITHYLVNASSSDEDAETEEEAVA